MTQITMIIIVALQYKTELNLENKQEKSRPNSDEFKRLLIGVALVT